MHFFASNSYLSVYADQLDEFDSLNFLPEEKELTPSNAKKASDSVVLKTIAEDGVTVVVAAEAGVLPEDTTVTAVVVKDAKAQQAVEEASHQENVAKRSTYDIKLWSNGSEIEPDITKGSVKVSFVIPENTAPSGADGIEVYHHTDTGVDKVAENTELLKIGSEDLEEITEEKPEEEKAEVSADETGKEPEETSEPEEGKTAGSGTENDSNESNQLAEVSEEVAEVISEVLQTTENKEVVLVEAEVSSFSYYTVDFTYEDKSVSIPGDEPAELSAVLAEVGITGVIENAVMSADAEGLVSVYKENNTWLIEGLTAFDTAHLLTVYMEDGTEYKVTVTDAEITVKFVGYAERETTGFRASELLEVVVTGADPTKSLKYKYTITKSSGSKGLGFEVYNTADQSVSDSSRRKACKYSESSSTKTLSSDVLDSKCIYASVMQKCGSSKDTDYALATLKVQVYYSTNTSTPIGEASYSNFADSSLEKDVLNANFIMYESDPEMEVTDWYGLTGIVHITCSNSYVENVSLNGATSQKIDSKTVSANEYAYTRTSSSTVYIKPRKAGETYFTATVGKNSGCDFHSGQEVAAKTYVRIIAKPSFESLSDCSVKVSNIVEGVSYTINGTTITVTAEDVTRGYITFYDLLPSTTYPCVLGITKTVDSTVYIFRREETFTTVSGHMHVWTYSASGNQAKATCSSTLGTHSGDNPVIQTISAPVSTEYTGSPVSASLSGTSLGEITLSSGDIRYTGTLTEGSAAYGPTETAPTAPGTYTASITFDTDKVASTSFTITKSNAGTASVTLDDWTYGETEKTEVPTSTTHGTEHVSYQYKKTSEGDDKYTNVKPTDAGSYTVKATFAETTNYNAVTATDNFQIAKSNAGTASVTLDDWTYGETEKTEVPTSSTHGTEHVSYQYKKTSEGDDKYTNVKPTDAGSYTVKATFAETTNYNAVTATDTFQIGKSNAGIASVTLDDWTYGETEKTEVPTSSTHGTEHVSYQYKKTSEGDDKYTSVKPTDAGSYTVKATFAETDNYNTVTATAVFSIHKKKVATPSYAQKKYNGNTQKADAEDTADYKVTENNGGINAGTYEVKLKLQDPDNYTWIDDASAPEISVNFTIAKADSNEIKELKIENWTYDDPDSPKVPELKAKFGPDNTNPAEYTYTGKDYTYGPTSEPPTEAGTYYLTVKIPGNDNYPEITKTIEFTIYPKQVSEPAIEKKVYNGQNQTADVPESNLYVVEENKGGVDVGVYDVVLELEDSRNYKWKNVNSPEETLKFEITKKAATEISDLKLDDWTYSEEPNTPSAKTPFGDEIIYYYIGRDGTEYGPSTEPPTDAGDYYLVAEVKETSNHGPAKEQKPFTINRKPIPVPVVDPKYYSGVKQKAYVETEEGYTITINEGGTDVGTYPVKLTPNKNYCWSNEGTLEPTEPVTVDFMILPDPQKEKGGETKKHEYPSGNANLKTETKVASDAPETVVKNLSLETAYNLLDTEEKKAYDDGDGVEINIYLDVKNLTEENLTEKEKEEIRDEVKTINNGSVGFYLDLTLNKEVTYTGTGSTSSSRIHDTGNNMIRICVKVPEILRRAGRKFYVGRVHDNVGEIIYGPTEADDEGNIEFETNKFSTYFVAIADPVVEEDEWGNWWKYSDAGWVFRESNQSWYYVENHALKAGWHEDPEDGKVYYLDPTSNIMATGWTKIGGYSYYFNPTADVQTWFTGSDGKWHYENATAGHRPLGSMYRNETTPDGYKVDISGHYVETVKPAKKFWNTGDSGWVKNTETSDWYYIVDDEFKTGWHNDPEDGLWYYLEPATGIMQTGWKLISGKVYYFNEYTAQDTWNQDTAGVWHYDTSTKGTHRPYGSMYMNETTPDGSRVGTDGAKVV